MGTPRVSDSVALSIVVAVTDETPPLTVQQGCPDWLAALLREALAVNAEILLVGAFGSVPAAYEEFAPNAGVSLRIIAEPGMPLAPVLWGRGLLASQAVIVAFTINQCVVEAGWARAALGALTAGPDVGVGGRIELSTTATMTGRAIYFLRYSAFLAEDAGLPRRVRDIAGDNAAYRRAVLMRHGNYAHGFWEIEPHHAMRAEGETLAMIPGMLATFGGAPRLGTFMRQRFAHGRHFGAWRVKHGGRQPWQIVVAAPLVPFVFLARAGRRVSAVRGRSNALLGCVFPFLALAAAWAAGEVAGALSSDVTRS